MSSLKEVRNQLLISHYEGLIDDEEFLLLYDMNMSNNLDLPYEAYEQFRLENLEDDECVSEFRFRKNDLPLLADSLGIPDIFKCDQRSVSDGMEALCMLLKRLAYPCRYSDMIARFAGPVPVLCMITNKVFDFIFDMHGHRIMEWNNTVLNSRSLEIYCNAIAAKGAALENCFGFVDGTVRPICRPGQHQRVAYNGH